LNDALTFARQILDWRFLTVLGTLLLVGLKAPVRFLAPFRSVRFNIGLFAVIAFASAIGTFLPQNKPAAESFGKVVGWFGPSWGPKVGDLFDTLGFFNIYHTWWFGGLFALMAFDVIACNLRRLPALPYGPVADKEMTPADLLARADQRAAFVSPKNVGETEAALLTWLQSKRMAVKTGGVRLSGAAAGGQILFAAKHRIQRWGDFILHVSIVAVLAGGLLGALLGFEEELPLFEGKTLTLKHRPYNVTLHDFDIEYYRTTGAPSLFASDLEVTENGRVLARKRIIVNDPLDLHGVRFYQASWGMAYEFRAAKLVVAGRIVELKPGVVTPLDGAPFSLRANIFYPTFGLDARGDATNVNFEGHNPALQIDFLEKGEIKGRIWLLKKRPDLAFRITDGAHVARMPPPPLRLLDVDPILFSGVKVGYDPGAKVFWFGAVTLLTGLCLHFYWHQRRLRFVVTPRGAGADVAVGVWTSRAAADFQAEFQAWVAEMKIAVGANADVVKGASR
jgi:cytochrome c biogenesis protein